MHTLATRSNSAGAPVGPPPTHTHSTPECHHAPHHDTHGPELHQHRLGPACTRGIQRLAGRQVPSTHADRQRTVEPVEEQVAQATQGGEGKGWRHTSRITQA